MNRTWYLFIIFVSAMLIFADHVAMNKLHRLNSTLVEEYQILKEENTRLYDDNNNLRIEIYNIKTQNNKEISRGAVDSLRHITLNMSAYCKCAKCTGDADGITTSQVEAQVWRTIAMASNIPFGTRVYIPYFKDKPNKGIFVVEDRGGAIRGNKVDVFMDTHQHALDVGRHNVDAYILD